jgi:hypothetical protein
MVGGMLLARMVGTSLTRQNGMIRVGNAWTVSSFDSDGTFGRAPSTMHILFDLRELVCIALLGP